MIIIQVAEANVMYLKSCNQSANQGNAQWPTVHPNPDSKTKSDLCFGPIASTTEIYQNLVINTPSPEMTTKRRTAMIGSYGEPFGCILATHA